jgi:hypothetical protein
MQSKAISRLIKRTSLVCALAIGIVAASAASAGAASYFGASGAYAPGTFSVDQTTGSIYDGFYLVDQLSSNTATLCATRAYNGSQKIVVHWLAYRWNSTYRRWDSVSSAATSATVAAGGCVTFPGWYTNELYGLGPGLYTVDWRASWQTTSGYTLASQGLALDAPADYQVAGNRASLGSVGWVNGRGAICLPAVTGFSCF